VSFVVLTFTQHVLYKKEKTKQDPREGFHVNSETRHTQKTCNQISEKLWGAKR